MDHMHVSGISLSSVNLRWRLFDPERGRWAAIFVGTDEYFLPSLVRPVHLFPPLPKSEYLFSTAKKKKKDPDSTIGLAPRAKKFQSEYKETLQWNWSRSP